MTTPEYITVQDLYAYAKVNKLLDARIRICDGMAVSYYPDPGALGVGRFEIVIDISANQPVEFDELDQWAQRQYDADRARHVHAQVARLHKKHARSKRVLNRAESV